MVSKLALGFAAFFAVLSTVAGIVYYVQARQRSMKELVVELYRATEQDPLDKPKKVRVQPGSASDVVARPKRYLRISGGGFKPDSVTAAPGEQIIIKNLNGSPVVVELPAILSREPVRIEPDGTHSFTLDIEGYYEVAVLGKRRIVGKIIIEEAGR